MEKRNAKLGVVFQFVPGIGELAYGSHVPQLFDPHPFGALR